MTASRNRPPRPHSASSSGTSTVRKAASSSGRTLLRLKKRRKPDRVELLDKLRETFPAAFTDPPKPLAIGIIQSVLKSGRWPLSGKQARRALYHWTQQPAYQDALVPGAPRYGLDGAEQGKVEPGKATIEAANERP